MAVKPLAVARSQASTEVATEASVMARWCGYTERIKPRSTMLLASPSCIGDLDARAHGGRRLVLEDAHLL